MNKVNEFKLIVKNAELHISLDNNSEVDITQFCETLPESPDSYQLEREILSYLGDQFYFINGNKPDLILPVHYGGDFQSLDNGITFFPGTFDPLHDGHVECMTRCPDKHILVMPDHNPWKEENKRSASPLNCYLDLVHILKDSPYSVFPGFLGLNHVNPTVDWLPQVHLKTKKLLMGADTFMAMEKWKNPDKLFSALNQLYVLGRKINIEHVEARACVMKQSYPDLKIEIFPENPHEDLSSTKLRNLQ